MSMNELARLEITDLERIERYRRAGYGGAVSDALYHFGIMNTVLDNRFKPLRQDMILVGRAVTVKAHSIPMETKCIAEHGAWEREIDARPGGHPQKMMMRTVAAEDPGSVLCFDCGGDMQPAHIGEMTCQLAYAQGCRGLLLGGNVRDTRYVLKMPDFPVFSFGTTPNSYGGWLIQEVNVPIHLPGHMTRTVILKQGDFIYGDTDGVLVIPKDYVDAVLLRVEWIFEKENKEREILASGLPIEEIYKQFSVL